MRNLSKRSKAFASFLSWFLILTISTPLVFATDEFNVLNLEVTEKINGVLIEIPLDQPMEYEIFKDQNQTITVNFYQGRLDTAFFNAKEVPGLLTWTKAYQFENSAQLSFKLKNAFVNYTHYLLTDPPRIQISLIHEIPPKDSAFYSVSSSPPEEKRLLNDPIDIIVIDPGHGGEDSGAVGKNGLLEKEVTLDIANKLKELLKNDKGIEVILTRDKDVLVPLEERAAIANQRKADIFLSIHTNASQKRSARGYETYFLSVAKNDEARAAAALENSSIRFEHMENQNSEDLDFILMDLVQSEFLVESSDLASMIQNRLKNKLSIPSRGVNQGGFVVLNKAYMPAVLVETAFISNSNEEALLKKRAFQQQIAQAIYESIKEFKKRYELIK
jgi:N-acetylmuramoyl-L-alanine amidase